MRVVYLGSGAFGLPTLEALARDHELAAVVTQPDRPAGRSRKPTPTPVGAWAAEHAPGARLFKPEDVNEPGVASEVRAAPADAWVVIAFGQKLSEPLLADRFAFNLHASLLPRWRGAAPINHAVLAGDAETGNSVITIAPRMDAGDVLGASRRPVLPDQTAGDLHDLLASDGPGLVASVLDAHARGAVVARAQDESLVTLAPKLKKADGWADFGAGAEACRRRINGLSPWPGVSAAFRGAPLRLLRAEPGPDAPEQEGVEPGTIIDAPRGLVACAGAGTLRLLEVQAEGRRAGPWADFANGRRVERGETLTGGAPC